MQKKVACSVNIMLQNWHASQGPRTSSEIFLFLLYGGRSKAPSEQEMHVLRVIRYAASGSCCTKKGKHI